MRTSGIIVFIFVSMLMAFGCSGSKESSETIKFYVGSSNGNLEHSIFLCELNLVGGDFAVLDSFAGAVGPSYLAFSPDRKHLYAIDDKITDPALNHMSVSSFNVNVKTHQLEFLNSQSSEGIGPCHVYCSQERRHTSSRQIIQVVMWPHSQLQVTDKLNPLPVWW